MTLLVKSGHDRQGRPVGVPYGAYARYILMFLQSEAVKTRRRQIELGGSMRKRLEAMGLPIGGETYNLVREQAERIAHCSLQFYANDAAGREAMANGAFIEASVSAAGSSPEHLGAWPEQVVLNERFFEALTAHPLPIDMGALRNIGRKAMAIDIYVWLAYRLHGLRGDVPVSWAALRDQFGSKFALLRKFRAAFRKNLEHALAAYPEARVTIEDRGLVLRPSPPAVQKRC